MNKQELQETIGFLFDPSEEIGCELYLVIKVDDQIEYRLADVGDENLYLEIKNGFLNYIAGRTIGNEDAPVLPISQLENSTSTIHYYDLEGLPDGFEMLNVELNTDDVQRFNFENDELSDIQGFLIKFCSTDKQVMLYKNHSHLNLLRQKNGTFFFKGDDRFIKPRDEIIRFSFTIDFLFINNHIFIYDLKCLQREFGFNRIIVNNAQNRIDDIEELGFVENIDELKEFASDKKGAQKILKLNSDSPVLSMQFDDIKEFVLGNPWLKRRLKFNDDKTMFRLHSKVSRNYFIELLNDNYLTSELTKKHYNSAKKDDMLDEEDSI